MSSEMTDESKETEQKKSSSMKFIVIGALVVLLGGGGFFGYIKFFRKDAANAAGKHEVAEMVMQELDTFLVNLSDPGGKRYLKLTMKAKLSNKQLAAEFTSRIFEIRDIILTLLSSKEYNEIARPEDKTVLKQEVAFQLNRVLQQGQVQEIYFTEFLVQ